MNRLNRRIYALLLTVTVAATNAYGMEAEVVNMVPAEQQSEVVVATSWYKTRQAQIAAAVTCALVGYVIAVRMNKISSPAVLLAALPWFASKGDKAATQNTGSDVVNDNCSADTNGGSSTDSTALTNSELRAFMKEVVDNISIELVNDNDNASGDQGKNDEQSTNADDSSSVVTNEENNNGDVSIIDEEKKETVIAENASGTQIHRNFQRIAECLRGVKNTGNKKFYELKDTGSKKFHEINDKWNRGE